jgi:predicted MFS family arabinose efflux permease
MTGQVADGTRDDARVNDNEAARGTLLRHRDFMLLWGGQTVSQIGSQVTILALPLVAIVTLKASTFEVGLLSTAVNSAYFLAALPAGVLVDRVVKRRLMVSCDMVLVIVIGSVPVAQLAGVLTLGQLYAVALIASFFDMLFSVTYTSYLPSLIERDQLMDGNGKLWTSQSFAMLAGPGLGALLVGLFGAARAMSSDALSYVVSVICLLLIRRKEPRDAQAGNQERPGFRAQMSEGLSYVLREPILSKAVAWSGTANFFVVMVEFLGPVFLVRSIHLRPAYVGALLALGAAGGVAGGFLSQILSRRIGSARLAWLSMAVFSPPGLLIPLAGPGWWVLLFAAGWMSWTFGATLCAVALVSYQQGTCPPALAGRVAAAARWVNWGTLPLGGVVGGILGSAFGVHTILWVAVIGGCSSGLWLYFSPLRHMRDLPTERLQPFGATH